MTHMKKILIMTNNLYGGGAEKVLQTMLLNLDYSKYDVTLYSMHRETLRDTYYPTNIRYRSVFDAAGPLKNVRSKVRGKLFLILPSGLFYRFIIHDKYDVEIAFIEGESTKIISGSPNKKSRKYAWVHIDLEKNPWTDFLYKGNEDERNHYLKFDRILCVSEGVKQAFVRKYHM